VHDAAPTSSKRWASRTVLVRTDTVINRVPTSSRFRDLGQIANLELRLRRTAVRLSSISEAHSARGLPLHLNVSHTLTIPWSFTMVTLILGGGVTLTLRGGGLSTSQGDLS